MSEQEGSGGRRLVIAMKIHKIITVMIESILKIISSLKIITSWLERWAPFLMGHLTEDSCRFIRD